MIATNNRRHLGIALAIVGFLFSIYALTFNGRITSIDELAIYSEAESLIQMGRLARPQLLFATYHNPVGPLEPVYSVILAAPYTFARLAGGISSIHTVMLIPPLLTAATGGIVYLTVEKLGYKSSVSVAVALIYGLSTIAWPYARTLYREPLLALIWSVIVLAIAMWSQGHSWVWAGVLIIGSILTVQIKVTAAAAVPVVLIAPLLIAGTERRAWILWTAGGLALTSTVVAVLIRYDSHTLLAPLFKHLIPSPEMVGRLYGLILSPDKGLVLFTPVVLLGVVGLPMLWKHSPPLGFTCLGVTLSVLYAYGSYSSWHAGWCWGPRFLVPLMPAMSLAIAPVLARRRLRWAAMPLVIISGLIQLAASTTDWATGYHPLVASTSGGEVNYGLPVTDLGRSPAVAVTGHSI